MGLSQDYQNIPDWIAKSEGYQTGAMVKYQGNIFYANFWASEPGVGDADHNGWRFYDELYDQTPHTPTEQAKIIAYIPTWRKKEGFNYANDEMYRYITHGIIAFLTFSEINLGEFNPDSVNEVYAILSDVINTGHRNGTRISIALGGAVDYGFLNLMTSIGNNSANPLLDQAVQNVVNFVNLNNLDGVDLDLECWWDRNGDPSKDQGGRPTSQGAHPAGYALTLFAQKLKQAMPDKLVSAAIFGTSWYGNNYDPKLADHVDWLGIMTYDLTGSWNKSPVGPHTTLFKIRNQESYVEEQQGEWPGDGMVNNPILSVEDTLWYWTNSLFVNWQGAGQKIPRNKIAAGVPIYGYDFAYGKDPDDLSGEVAPGYKSIRYKDILAQFPDAHTAANGNIKVSGSTPRPPFISASGNYPYAHNIYFETPDTAVAKLNFLKNVGAQGVIIWELSNDVWEDNKSIIKALYQNSGNGIKPPLGNPTPELGEVGLNFLRLTEEDKHLIPLANLVSQSEAVNEEQLKTKIMRDVLKPAAFLAHLLGYGWCGGCKDEKPGFVGEEFVPIREEGKEGWKAIYTNKCEGFMADKRLKIYFSDWSFSIKTLNVGDVKNTEKTLIDSSKTSVENSAGNTPLEQTVGGAREVLTQVQTYDLKTVKWEVGAEVNATFKTPLNFLGGIDVSVKVSAKGGQDTQTGIVTTTSDKTTITNTVKATVPPGSRKDYRIDVYGTESKSDNCSIVIEVRFALEFDGFLRWGRGNTPDSNYHKEYRGSEARPTVPYKFGINGRSFAEDLKYQMEHLDESVWDWKLLLQDHKQDLEWATYELTQKQKEQYAFNFNFGLEGIKGTNLEITTLN